ncbi:MAG: hypothetical protein JST73_00790, partial [Actinobacteria bacterium]|nr:hypothetical protein [Actinomycetota bacterium]
VAVAATITAFVFRARVTYYGRQLESALGESGSDSYLGYQLDRIDGYINSEHQRRHQAAVQADVDEALARWKLTAGDVDLDWAVEHRPAIEAAAGLRSAEPTSDGTAVVARHASDETPELIDTLVSRLTKNRRFGSEGESFPVPRDEHFGVFDPGVRPALLETLVRQAGSPQVIVLTNSEDIVSWARLEAMAGVLGLVGPGQNTEHTPAATDEDQSDATEDPRGPELEDHPG